MAFFKPTPPKLGIAIVLTIWPYVVSFLFVTMRGEGAISSDSMVQTAFWYHAWEWSPLYLLLQIFSKASVISLSQSKLFIFLVYPVLRFSVRYVAACILVFLASKLIKKHKNIIHA